MGKHDLARKPVIQNRLRYAHRKAANDNFLAMPKTVARAALKAGAARTGDGNTLGGEGDSVNGVLEAAHDLMIQHSIAAAQHAGIQGVAHHGMRGAVAGLEPSLITKTREKDNGIGCRHGVLHI